MSRTCMGCGLAFEPRPNVPSQGYCGRPECRRTRRARWQREKLRADADYREAQREAQSDWQARHREYMRVYRSAHPRYRERERCRRRDQRRTAVRDARRNEHHPPAAAPDAVSAVKMDSWIGIDGQKCAERLESAVFRVCRVISDNAVKMDSCPIGRKVQLIVLQEDRRVETVPAGAP
jgi:hypothetical protein